MKVNPNLSFLLLLKYFSGETLAFLGQEPTRPLSFLRASRKNGPVVLLSAENRFSGTTTTTTTTVSKPSNEVDRESNKWITDGLNKRARYDKTVVGPELVQIYDTTLRDGTQGESVSASADDKLKICQRLANFHVDFIEAGWPGSNPKDAEFFKRAKTELPKQVQAKLSAFGSTRRKNIAVEGDPQVQALLDSEAPTICIVAKSHAWQVTDILKATLEENLKMISDTVQYLVQNGRNVMVDLEHFFDGYKENPEYAIKCCEAAADAGASCLVLCDTNGGSMPWEVGQISSSVVKHFEGLVTIGIHSHNDCGMAVANSLTAAQNGIGLIQGTINGIGERTGNADLCSIVPSLALHMNSQMSCRNSLSELTSLSRFVDEILNRTPNHSSPYVGSSAFAHKGGLHVAAMERSPLSYQHVDPELVGNEKRILISELSGRQNILGLMEQVGVSGQNERAVAILNRVKELESKGYTFEGAEASVHLMILHASQGYCPPFEVLDYSAQVYDSHIDSASRVLKARSSVPSSALGPTARATIKVRAIQPVKEQEDSGVFRVDDDDPITERLEVGDGNGPVDALANALMRALVPIHPSLEHVELVDYKVRILDPASATKAATRVMIEFRETVTDTTWTTVSVDTNIISASVNALVDGLEYALIEYASLCMLCDDDYDE